MAGSILDTLFKKSPLTIVNDVTGLKSFTDLAIVSVDLMPETTTSESPLYNQDGTATSVYDSGIQIDTKNTKIIRPVKLKIHALSNNPSTVENLMVAFQDARLSFSITSKAIISDAMVMTDMVITQSAEMTAAVDITIELEQAFIPKSNAFAPKGSANASSFGLRIQQPQSLATNAINKVTSTVSGLYDKVSSLF